MEDDRRNWLSGCAIGCGTLVAVSIVVAVGGVMSVTGPLGRAVDDRAQLDLLFGEQCSYTPPVDGAVPTDRIEAFLRVRTALAVPCLSIQQRSEAMRRLEQLDDTQQVSRSEVMILAGKATLGALRLGPALGELFEVRNRVLLGEGMGLGEYSYIYLTAYHAQLTDPPPRTGIMDSSPINGRIHECVGSMLTRQLEAARAGGLDPGWLQELEAELAALAVDPARFPWHEGLPAAIESAYLPYRTPLDDAFCAAATELELLQNTRRFLAIESG